MSESDFGAEGMTDADRAYAGSRYSEVVAALFENPYQRVWGGAGEAALPVHEVTLGRVLEGFIKPSATHFFRKATERAVDSRADLRWGSDRKGFLRLLHPNGVCLTGRWHIDQPTKYSGYFAQGSTALTVARYSTCCTETRRGHNRSLSLVGKLYPTTDVSHPTPLRTASFITQEDIGGSRTDFINDIELLNAPDTTASMRGSGVAILVATGAIFSQVDKEPTVRQLYEIAELGKPASQPTLTPAYLRLLVAADQPRIPGDALDFRDEVMAHIFDAGDPAPKRTLTFTIEITDEGTTTGTPFKQRRTFQNWRRIGTLTFDNAVISYNGDAVIHFHHPTWRDDRNDPITATRVNERKVR